LTTVVNRQPRAAAIRFDRIEPLDGIRITE